MSTHQKSVKKSISAPPEPDADFDQRLLEGLSRILKDPSTLRSRQEVRARLDAAVMVQQRKK